jgi:hypothetical protein
MRDAARRFFATTGAGVAAFAVYGVFNSLDPTFLAGTSMSGPPAWVCAAARRWL